MNSNQVFDLKEGQIVRITPGPGAPEGLAEAVEAVKQELGGPVAGTVHHVFANGRCCVILKNRSAIPGFSHPRNSAEHYIDIGCDHLEAVS